MKKFLVFAVALSFVLGFAGVSFAAVDALYEVTVIDVQGDVKADLKGDGKWVVCFNELKLMKGAKIKTGPGASAQIAYDNQGMNVLQIKENTEITIDDSMAKLANGSVLALFKNLKPGSSFTVKTPTAACGIRGSGMGIDFINGMTVVAAYEDKVFVQGLDAAGNPVGVEVTIPEGWKSEVATGGGVTQPAGLTDNEKAVWSAFVQAVQAGAGLAPEQALLESQEEGETDTKDLSEQKGISVAS